jgi:hypothetical protein
MIDRIVADVSGVEGLREFLSDEARAMQAYLSLRNETWESPEGRDVNIGWIGCSTLVGRMRGMNDEPTSYWWWDHSGEVEPSEPEMAEFQSLMTLAGWRRKVPGEAVGPSYFS